MTPVRANLAHNAIASVVDFYGTALASCEQQLEMAAVRIKDLSIELKAVTGERDKLRRVVESREVDEAEPKV